jgi:hypothetical protein
MRRIYGTIILLAAGSLPVAAQRLDGCPEHETPVMFISAVSGETLDRGLRDAGYTLTRDALAIALGDPRAEVRSLAALKLGRDGKKANLASMMQAWLAERDTCTEAMMHLGLSTLVSLLARDAELHPGGQWRVTPFQACTASQPPLVSLAIEQVTDPLHAGPAVRITARNETAETLAFAKTATPTELFSVTVLGPTGAPTKVPEGQERLYQPIGRDLGLAFHDHSPMFVPLPPQEDVSWIWRIGDDFDMSAPGTYRVSFGGRIAYLDTTACSNTASVIVEK